MTLSYQDIETLGRMIRKDFDCAFPRAFLQRIRALEVDRFADQYLGLHVYYRMLSRDKSLLGLTTYAETKLHLPSGMWENSMTLSADTVLLDRSLTPVYVCTERDQIREYRRRFTLAHECAHQILYRLQSPKERETVRQGYAERKRYNCRDLKSKEDWNEWQANALAAVLLMPEQDIQLLIQTYHAGRPLISYGGKFQYADLLSLKQMSRLFGVSNAAVCNRLRKLGLLELRPYQRYRDRMDVNYEEI